jgi:hypothetical protein
MRTLVLAVVVLFPSLAGAQEVAYTPAPLIDSRPQAAVMKSPFPMTMIDEGVFRRGWDLSYPKLPWNQAMTCLAHMGVPMSKMGSAPSITVVPYVQTFRVRDLTLDSLLMENDTTAMPGAFSAPAIGYTLLRSNVVLVTEPYRENTIMLRHEAIHVILWRVLRLYGHVPQTVPYFMKCDTYYKG